MEHCLASSSMQMEHVLSNLKHEFAGQEKM
jgi:hypothetical protein